MDMKWWLNYTIKVQFNNFPWPNKGVADSDWIDDAFMGKENVFCWRPWPLHQCTDNIHLRINNRDMVCYPTQTLNQRMEYWQQDKFKESCGFCPHRKPNVQDTYQYHSLAGNTGRYPFLNVGATYDGDFGNDFLFDSVTTDQDGIVASAKTYHELALVAGNAADAGQYPPWTNGTGAMYFKFREPVMAEPLIIIHREQGARL